MHFLIIFQLVENVATCLINIAERVRHSSDRVDELCKHGLIHQATHLIDLNSRTTLCQPVYTVCNPFYPLLLAIRVCLIANIELECECLYSIEFYPRQFNYMENHLRVFN